MIVCAHLLALGQKILRDAESALGLRHSLTPKYPDKNGKYVLADLILIWCAVGGTAHQIEIISCAR